MCYSCIVANFSIIQFYWIEISEIHGNEIKGKPAQTSIYRRTSFFFLLLVQLYVCLFVFSSVRKISSLVCGLRYIFAYKSINVDFFHIKMLDLFDYKVDLTINACCAFYLICIGIGIAPLMLSFRYK